jgi:hypothetical protein
MVRQAPRDPLVTYALGRAECIPLRDRSCGAVWMSHVFHHVADRGRCALEVRRVLQPQGTLFVRACFSDRLDGIAMYKFFPGARHIAEALPTLKDTIEVFGACGFRVAAVRRLRQVLCSGLAELASRTRLRTDSTLALLDEAEFARGQALLERAAAAERAPAPIREPIDVLVLNAP